MAETAVVQPQGSKKIALSWEKGVQQSETCVGNPADSLICSTQVHEFHMCSYHVDLQPQDNHEKLRALTLFAAESKKNVVPNSNGLQATCQLSSASEVCFQRSFAPTLTAEAKKSVMSQTPAGKPLVSLAVHPCIWSLLPTLFQPRRFPP